MISLANQLWNNYEVLCVDSASKARDAFYHLSRVVDRELFIVDPYVNSLDDLAEVLTPKEGLTVRILLDKDNLRYLADLDDAAMSIAVDRKHDIQIRSMGGKSRPIHDRFLVSGSRCWIIGSSFGELGRSKTAFITNADCLCDPPMPFKRSEIILKTLEESWSSALKLFDIGDFSYV